MTIFVQKLCSLGFSLLRKSHNIETIVDCSLFTLLYNLCICVLAF